MLDFFAIRVAHDSTGYHFEYYATIEDYEDGYGYPVDTLNGEVRERVLLDILDGKYAVRD
jgi:hypothetical protein